MKMSVKTLRRRDVQRLIIESVDLSLYIAHAEIDGLRYLIADDDGRVLKTPNLLGMKERLARVRARELVLQQRSAYDEMVGCARGGEDNQMEVRLGPGYESLPPWQH